MIQYWRRETNQHHFFKSKALIFYFTISLSFFVTSCKNSESDLGLNLRPDKGEFYSAETDTFTVNAFTVNEDSIKTDSLSTNILGVINDPPFGISVASIASEITVTQVGLSFGTTPKVDSVILYIRWDKIYNYGNTNTVQTMKIYTLNEKIEDSKKYFSNHKTQIGTQIGTWSGIFNIKDSVTIKEGGKTVKKAPGLLIKLQKDFGELLANANASVYSSVPTFKEFIKGIVLVPQQTGLASGQGAIVGIDFFSGNSQLMVNYNDTSQHVFVFNNNCENFNTYDIKHTNPDLLNQLSNPGKHYNTTFVQSMSSCKTKIEIPYLFNLVENTVNQKIVINEAALVFTPLNGSVSSYYALPSRLYLFEPDKVTKENKPILDFIDFLDPELGPFSLYGGTYNSLTGEYTIRFTRQLQFMLDQYKLTNDKNFNRGFYVTIPSDKPITPTRLILDNTRLPNHKALKFRITYSKIKT
ncbi:MAG: DUF4270 family protein [Bacteroidia bacterium]